MYTDESGGPSGARVRGEQYAAVRRHRRRENREPLAFPVDRACASPSHRNAIRINGRAVKISGVMYSQLTPFSLDRLESDTLPENGESSGVVAMVAAVRLQNRVTQTAGNNGAITACDQQCVGAIQLVTYILTGSHDERN